MGVMRCKACKVSNILERENRNANRGSSDLGIRLMPVYHICIWIYFDRLVHRTAMFKSCNTLTELAAACGLLMRVLFDIIY